MLKRLFRGMLSNNAAPGAVLLGPTYRSQHNIYMTSDPIVQAAKRSVVLHEAAISHIAAMRVDRALACLQESLEILQQGLPPKEVKIVEPAPVAGYDYLAPSVEGEKHVSE